VNIAALYFVVFPRIFQQNERNDQEPAAKHASTRNTGFEEFANRLEEKFK
jgi:hypothetical protein